MQALYRSSRSRGKARRSLLIPGLACGPWVNVDEAGKTGYYRALLGGIERLEVVSISPARHFVMLDQPGKFNAALDAALKSMVAVSGN